ncbi:Glucosaminyl phosphatidylinositol (GlcN-PI) nositol acylation protein [Malassezia psittaci]|uniref:GPI-anchored wall transfer protein 1 n=1 Tax=Malassezia psittaci TaxID=1821823 RepID=A0AAF0F7V2_9BASI|nr:Glucosaminyl phosphatidylinositol (GlcN-PI) nositol acylation protein [Malassezia psittaci]
MPPDWHTYKLTKEAFVAGHTGSSVLKINQVCATALVSYAVWLSLQKNALFLRSFVIFDWLILVAPLGLACTVLATDVYTLLACMLLTVCVVECAQLSTKKLQKQHAAVQESVSCDKRSETLTIYRTYLMILTVLCILAVDFPVFPRAFAKCETWGTSLMDLGVGSFVFSHATVSRRKQPAGDIYRTLRRTLPLWVLGLARVVMVKGTEYPEHVSEYGVHWNFFLTLGIIIPLLDGIQVALSSLYMVWGLLLGLTHEMLLCTTELSAWAIADVRDPHSLISLNKEGIVSLPGYFAIALCGLDVAATVQSNQVISGLAWRTISYWISYSLLRVSGWDVSRRLANMPYVLWTAAFNTLFLLGFAILTQWNRKHCYAPRTPRLLDRINARSLRVFLLVRTAIAYTGKSINRTNQPHYTHDAQLVIHVDCMGHPGLVSIASNDDLGSEASSELGAQVIDKLLDRLTEDAAPGQSVEDKRRAKLEEYNSKLQAKAKQEGLTSVEELAEKHRKEQEQQKKIQREEQARIKADRLAAETAAKQNSVEERDRALQERLRLQREQEEARKLREGDTSTARGPVKPLSSFLDIEKIQKESNEDIGKLWAGYHTMRGKLSAVIPAGTYEKMLETARSYPQFVLPLPKGDATSSSEEDNAFEMQFMQWAFLPRPASLPNSTPPPAATMFTSLAEYKLRQEFAQMSMVLTYYTDLVQSKGLVLMRGDITERQVPESDQVKQVLTQNEAQILALCMQRFYNVNWSQPAQGQEADRRELLQSFHKNPQGFDLEKLLETCFTYT